MPHRSQNRALGRTGLELKCLFVFGVVLLFVITVSFLLYWRVTEKVVYGQCFGIYAFSEYALATGDPAGREAAERT